MDDIVRVMNYMCYVIISKYNDSANKMCTIIVCLQAKAIAITYLSDGKSITQDW